MSEKKTQSPYQRFFTHSVQRHFNSIDDVIRFLESPTGGTTEEERGSSPMSNDRYEAPIQTELFSSKPKRNDVEYKYFSPMESHRESGDKWDPDFYEANDSWEKDAAKLQDGFSRFKFWVWVEDAGMGVLGWQMHSWEIYQEARKPKTNEWGEVGA